MKFERAPNSISKAKTQSTTTKSTPLQLRFQPFLRKPSFLLYPKDYKVGSVHYAAYITVKALASCLVLIIGDTTMLIRQGLKNGLSEYYYNFFFFRSLLKVIT